MDEHRLIEKFDLKSRIEFDPSDGQIWFDETRMLLVHARALGITRRQLVEQLGSVKARKVFWRLGFECGRQDARLAVKHLGDADDVDVFGIGPALHALEGVTHADIVEAKFDWEAGVFEGTVHWCNSWEAQAHLEQGLSGEVDGDGACWSITGYASGYVTEFFKRPVIFKETQCICHGHAHCISVGKPVDMWDDEPSIQTLMMDREDDRLLAMESELRELRRGTREGALARQRFAESGIVGAAPSFMDAFTLLEKAASSRINVLLLGETGVGKEVFARWLHKHGKEASGPFVAVNCSAIPAELMEAELFGVRRGAYTGAAETRAGRFERAHNGTLFLDEVGDLPLAAQAKLLRVLQTGEVERLGDDQPLKVNVRIISATNVDLGDAMKAGGFRSDLFYRLATYPVTIPALRNRPGDIKLLAQSMLTRFAPVYGKDLVGITERALHVMEAYDWPGNVRELENIMERAVLLATDGEEIGVGHLTSELQHIDAQMRRTGSENGIGGCADRHRQICEQLLASGVDLESHADMLVDLALQQARGNIAAAAKMLNISRRQLAYRLQKRGAPGEDTGCPG